MRLVQMFAGAVGIRGEPALYQFQLHGNRAQPLGQGVMNFTREAVALRQDGGKFVLGHFPPPFLLTQTSPGQHHHEADDQHQQSGNDAQ